MVAFRSQFLVLISMVCWFRPAVSAEEHPHVLLLLVDDLKPAIGAYGDPHARTPHLDAFVRSAMRFERAYCNQAVCAPSRFTLMLGAHSTRTGLYGLGSRLREIHPNAVTMPQYFAQHGYRTESLGKIFHIGHGNEGDPESFSVPHFSEKVIEYVDPDSTQGGQLTREEAYFTNQRLGEIRSLPRGAAWEAPNVADNAYADGRVAEETIRRLEAARQRQVSAGTPFFIAAGFARPHLPFSAPKKYWDLYDPRQLPMPEFTDLPDGSPPVAGKRGGEITNYFPVPEDRDAVFAEDLQRSLIHGYYASVSYTDAQIGKVLNSLETLGLAENTIVVLWGDHGFHLGDLGIWTKHTNYEQANRIPIVVRAPGVTEPGSVTGQPAESVDLYPTIAALAGLPRPEVPQGLDGVNLMPVLRNPGGRVRDHAFHAYPKRKLGRAIRTERYRLVEWKTPGAAPETAELELYDYAEDPLETKNLAKEQPEVVQRLLKTLSNYPEAVDRNGRPPARAGVEAKTPQIRQRMIHLSAEVRGDELHGVVLAQGGREHGYALHFDAGRATLDVRIRGKVTRLQLPTLFSGNVSLAAMVAGDRLFLKANEESALLPSRGLIPVQPQDGLSVGEDTGTAAGNYRAPNPLNGMVRKWSVEVSEAAEVQLPQQ